MKADAIEMPPRALTAARRWAFCCAVFALLSAPVAQAQTAAGTAAYPERIDAQYRGCTAQGWCLFEVAPPDARADALIRVRPLGADAAPRDAAAALARRDRLNALLAGMIHQHKRIELHALRALDDGTFAATVTVNGLSLASDPVLMQLQQGAGATR